MSIAQRGVAIIGVASRFPGADGTDAYWEHLVGARDLVGQVPPERWDASAFAGDTAGQAGRTYTSAVGMDAAGDCYDAGFFGINPAEAKHIDPQQGRVLELAWHACEDAGIPPDALSGQEVGVFIGVSTRDFDRRMSGLWPHLNAQTSTGASAAIVANRLSYLFGLTGPSVVVDSACASSLSAVHMACMALDNDECTMAFAGGVQLILSPANIIAFAQNGLLARDGRCKPFSVHADGYVCGEGAGLVLLKPLEHALRDGDNIRAVIRGSAVNHNGRSNGLSAPYRAGQQKVIGKALARSGLAPSQIGYVEAHAPGTRIGDAIEMQALRDTYGATRPDGQPCRVGSVKSNIGHLEAAAGIAALIKVALMVERGRIPASLHCQPLSDLLKPAEGILQVCCSTHDWPEQDGPRAAAVSAFGFGGANAHMIVTQAPPAPARANEAPGVAGAPWVLAVSARSEAAFASLCAAYADHLQDLEQAGAGLDALRDFCFATLVRRQHHGFRRAFAVAGWQQARAALLEASPAPAGHRQLTLTVQGAEGEAGSIVATDELAALLKRLGIRRLQIAATDAAPVVQAFSESAQRHGLELRAAATVDGVTVRASSSSEDGAGFLWRSAGAPAGQDAQLAVSLYERGFELAWRESAALAGAKPTALPLYPFERARHHRIPDSLAAGPGAAA